MIFNINEKLIIVRSYINWTYKKSYKFFKKV